jgi:SAM-dependent methyltransferase
VALAKRHAGAVGGDRVEPGAEPGRVGQPRQTQEGRHNGLLSDVLGVGAGAEQPPAQPQDARLPACQQRAERLAVAGQYRCDQFDVIASVAVHDVIVLPEEGRRSHPPGESGRGSSQAGRPRRRRTRVARMAMTEPNELVSVLAQQPRGGFGCGAMPLPDATFDVALCQQGLQFFPDRSAALGELRRVLAPGGRVAIAVWRFIEHNPAFVVLTRRWSAMSVRTRPISCARRSPPATPSSCVPCCAGRASAPRTSPSA